VKSNRLHSLHREVKKGNNLLQISLVPSTGRFHSTGNHKKKYPLPLNKEIMLLAQLPVLAFESPIPAKISQ
jgi:hypothetical protein